MNGLTDVMSATLLASIRLAPVFAFAPPFSLTRVPALARLSVTLGLGAWIASSFPAAVPSDLAMSGRWIALAAGELVVGTGFAFALAVAYGAMQFAGRVVDFQVGFGLALIADPSLRGQMPLVGALFAWTAAAVFFASGGATELAGLLAASFKVLPLGAAAGMDADSLARMTALLAAAFTLALGLAGLLIVTMFVVDLAVAYMSRTLPQMNVLLLSFQVKTIVLLLVLPLAMATTGSVYLRLARMSLDAIGAGG